MRASVAILGVLILLVSATAFLTEGQAQGPAYNITERTIYDLTENIVFVTIQDLTGKDQYINVSNIFPDSQITREVTIKDVLMLQDYNKEVMGLANVSQGKYSRTENNCTAYPNGTVCIDYYYNNTELMDCDYVLADKSCLKTQNTQIGTTIKQKYLPVPGMKQKTVIGGQKIEQKSEGIPLPKNGKVELMFKYKHPIAYGLGNRVTAVTNKYNITVTGDQGDTGTLDPTWYNTSWNHRRALDINTTSPMSGLQILINVTEQNATANFSDIRFVADDHSTVFNACNWTQNDGSDVLVWINLTNSTNVTIFMYYNTTNAIANWDCNATFLYYEDFENYADGSQLVGQGGWTGDSGGIAIVDAVSYEGDKSVRLTGDDVDDYTADHSYTTSTNVTVLGTKAAAQAAGAIYHRFTVYNGSNQVTALAFRPNHDIAHLKSGPAWDKIADFTDNQWYDFNITVLNSTSYMACVDKVCEIATQYQAGNPSSMRLWNLIDGLTNDLVWFDSIYVANSTYPYPTTTFGPQEDVAVDSDPPIITIQEPRNITYTNRSIWFNVTLNEAGDTCLVDYGFGNNTMTNSSGNWNHNNASMIDGGYQSIFWCNDTAGNMNTTNINFSVDATAPVFTNIINHTHTVNTSFSYDINATDVFSGIDSFTINSTNFTINISTGVLTNATRLNHTRTEWINVTVNDTANNTAWAVFYIQIVAAPGPSDTSLGRIYGAEANWLMELIVIFRTLIMPIQTNDIMRNNTIFFSLDDEVLVYKDSDGEINELYGMGSTNSSYGEMWNYSSNATAWDFDIDAAGVYYNLTNLTAGETSGFSFTDAAEPDGGSYLTAGTPGLYKASFSFSFEASQTAALYGMAIVENFNVNLNRQCYARRLGAKNAAGNVGIECFMRLAAGDIVNIQIENEDNNRDIKVHAVNLNLLLIDD